MESKFKSFDEYLRSLISQFELADFQPPVDKSELLKRFNEIVVKDCPYWTRCDLAPNWQTNWSAIEIRSHRDWDSLFVAFSIRKSVIEFVVTSGFRNSQFENALSEGNVDMTDVWLDHERLFRFLESCTKPAIAYVNRKDYEAAFPKSLKAAE